MVLVGMYVRLGFAVSAHSIRTSSWSTRCSRSATRRSRNAASTASMRCARRARPSCSSRTTSRAVERLCQRALLLQAGTVVKDATPAEITRAHRQWAAAENGVQSPDAGSPSADRHYRWRVRRRTWRPRPRQADRRSAHCQRLPSTRRRDIEDIVFEVGFTTQGGSVLHCVQTTALDGDRADSRPRRGRVRLQRNRTSAGRSTP